MESWKGDIHKPLVSICCITYNHEPYIKDALEGFLMQETDFPFEILIHDDASTDCTSAIIQEYASKYSRLIKPIYQTENQFSKGIKPNANFNFPRVQGKYIAMCEGDDYWTDQLKLQKQTDFLESNLSYTGSGHQTKILSLSKKHNGKFYRQDIKETLYKDDFLRDCPFQTSSLVFKSETIKKHTFFVDVLSGDKALMILISRFGLVKYFDQPMSNYRVHKGGISGHVTMKMMKKDLNIISWIMKIDPNFPKYKYASYLHGTIMLFPVDKTLTFFVKHFFLFLLYSFSYFPENVPVVYRMIVRFCFALVNYLRLKKKLILKKNI